MTRKHKTEDETTTPDPTEGGDYTEFAEAVAAGLSQPGPDGSAAAPSGVAAGVRDVIAGLGGKVSFLQLLKFLPLIIDLLSGGKSVKDIIPAIIALLGSGG